MTSKVVRVMGVAALALALAMTASSKLAAQRGGGGGAPAGPPPAPQQLEPENLSLEGYWVSIVNEDWRWRMVTPPPGDFASLPLTQAGQDLGNQWTPAQDGSCQAYGVGGLMRMPTRLHITWASDSTLQIETDAGNQTRQLHFDAADLANMGPSLQGNSVAEWVNTGGGGGRGRRGGGPPPPPTAPQFGTLHVMTDNTTGGWIRKNGAPYSDQATVEEYFDNFLSPTDDAEWLVVTTIVRDPLYINGDYITSSHFRREAGPNGPQPANWDPAPCRQ